MTLLMESPANTFTLIKHEKLTSQMPNVVGKNVKVWKIKQNETIRINWVEISGELSLHTHPDAEHSLMVLEGELRVQIGNDFIVMRKGDFISIPAGIPHKYWSLTEKSQVVSMDAPYYDPSKTVLLE